MDSTSPHSLWYSSICGWEYFVKKLQVRIWMMYKLRNKSISGKTFQIWYHKDVAVWLHIKPDHMCDFCRRLSATQKSQAWRRLSKESNVCFTLTSSIKWWRNIRYITIYINLMTCLKVSIRQHVSCQEKEWNGVWYIVCDEQDEQ